MIFWKTKIREHMEMLWKEKRTPMHVHGDSAFPFPNPTHGKSETLSF